MTYIFRITCLSFTGDMIGLSKYCLVHLKMLGCFKPNLGQIWMNPTIELKM